MIYSIPGREMKKVQVLLGFCGIFRLNVSPLLLNQVKKKMSVNDFFQTIPKAIKLKCGHF